MPPVTAIRTPSTTAEIADAARLLTLFFREEGFTTPERVIFENCRKMVGTDACGLFVAYAADEPAGVATVSLNFGIEFGWLGELGDLYVLPQFRGRGIARTLIDAVEAHLKGKGVSGYQVTVTPYAEERHSLKNYYLGLGFIDEGRSILHRSLVGGR